MGPFEGLSDNISILTSISSAGLKKKGIFMNWREKIMKIYLRISNKIQRQYQLNKIFVKSIVVKSFLVQLNCSHYQKYWMELN